MWPAESMRILSGLMSLYEVVASDGGGREEKEDGLSYR
jgi:hypothetical protein